ncbi:tol-pal system-associated acyl-CoA thioesterase [Alteromonas sediminis]|uniref:Tol-pal system-associated acyl-CoA thioesterase n=1 Tax=Alteromonas sediminis TaxID=2259342 RepID=A0A3N5ZBA9_9ALTE|nr:tol-pal system-associated acyl-CoA thioesterase [Alteromonas sediminis]RPJ68554.1 tol-pal system-associated acyl-CoA thioesterase [Alteromonas sediminis]
MSHSMKVRVYFEDTDAGGIVYHANYLKFMERGRTDWLRELGFSQDVLLNQNIAFVVKKLDIDYVNAAKFDQLLTVNSSLSTFKKASLQFEQTITDEQDRQIAVAKVLIACVNTKTLRPTKTPEPILSALSHV